MAQSQQGWLGFGYTYHQAVNGERFVLVRQIFVDGPAARAGLRVQDVITRLNGKPIRFPSDIAAVRFFDSIRSGQRISFTVKRLNRTFDLTMKAESTPQNIVERRLQNERLVRARSRQ